MNWLIVYIVIGIGTAVGDYYIPTAKKYSGFAKVASAIFIGIIWPILWTAKIYQKIRVST